MREHSLGVLLVNAKKRGGGMAVGLFVNVDPVAAVRRSGKTDYPDPVAAAILAELAGANGVVCYVGRDRKNIQDDDVKALKKVIQTKLIVRMTGTSETIGFALDIKPEVVTLVPESYDEMVVGGGLDLVVHHKVTADAVATLKNSGIKVSIFIDPDPEQVKLAHQINADIVELNTGQVCGSNFSVKQDQAYYKVVDAAKLAKKLRLIANAGSGLCYRSVKLFRGLKEVDQYVIGHSIISRALLVGMDRAVRDMRELIADL